MFLADVGNQELDEKKSKFGDNGIIPFDVTKMNYEEYLKKHHVFLVERYHSFMHQNPNFFGFNQQDPMGAWGHG